MLYVDANFDPTPPPPPGHQFISYPLLGFPFDMHIFLHHKFGKNIKLLIVTQRIVQYYIFKIGNLNKISE